MKKAVKKKGVATDTVKKLKGKAVKKLKGAIGKAEKVETKVVKKIRKSESIVATDVTRQGKHLKNGKLKANVTYRTGEYKYAYKTDSKGRINSWKTDNLQLTKRTKRLPHNSNTPGKLKGDHAGHLAADRFGGSPEIDNLVSQSSSVNLSEYKKMENQWAKAISQGKKVAVNLEILYEGESLRPKGFKVKYTIDGVAYNKRIRN